MNVKNVNAMGGKPIKEYIKPKSKAYVLFLYGVLACVSVVFFVVLDKVLSYIF